MHTKFKHQLRFLLVALFLSALSGAAIAQQIPLKSAPRLESAVLQRSVNQAFLLEWARQDSLRFTAERDSAIRIAARYGYPVDSKGGKREFSLRGFDEAGMLEYNTNSNAISAIAIRTDQVHPGGGAGLNLTGNGTTLGVWEISRPRTTHAEFSNRITQIDNSNQTVGNHATHVSGTMIAAGVDPDARGMAYQANLAAWDANNDHSEMAAAAAQGLRFSNHSYGTFAGWDFDDHSGQSGWHWFGSTSVSQTTDFKFGQYDTDARDLDIIARNAPLYLPVRSAGNNRNDSGPSPGGQHWVRNTSGQWITSTTNRQPDGGTNGYDCIPTRGNAKNVLTVGALEFEVSGGLEITGMSEFSGWGPTDDGRIKPDIVARGVDVWSPIATNNTAYDVLSGTSMAAPSVTASLGLLLQHYENLNPQYTLPSSALKGLVIHTADQIDGTGPNYRTGWGRMDTRAAADFISDLDAPAPNSFLIVWDTVYANTPRNWQFTHTGGPLKLTIAWIDPAGAVQGAVLNPSSVLRLVNDLDLRLIRQSDNVSFLPWRLDPASPAAAATRGDNFRDNVEQIFESNLPAGNYTIRISHKNSLSGGNQTYSLLISAGQQEEAEGSSCSNAIPISCGDIVTTNTASGQAQNVPECDTPLNTAPGKWFTFEGTGEFIRISTCNPRTEFDTKIGIFAGDCNNLICIGGDDDDPDCIGATATSTINLLSIEGETYYVYLTGYLASAGTAELSLECTSPPTCTGNTPLSACSGTVSDGSGSGDYTPNLDCSWTINPPGASSVTLNFSSFGTETNFDFVRIYNGLDASAPLIGEFSGYSTPGPVTANSGKMFIRFQTDGSVGAGGWTANYTCANNQFSINTDSIFFEANGTPSNTFGISSTCSWSLGAPPAWLSVSPSSGTGNTIVTATCTPNNNTQSRSFTLVFTGCGSITRQVYAFQKGCTLPGAPSISASGPTSFCPGSNVTLTAANVCNGCTVSWSNGMNGTAITVNAAGTYTATVANPCGASAASNSIPVTVLSNPTTPSASASGDTELCPGESVTLNATNVCAGCTVMWSNNQTGTSIVVNTPGVYTATASNACGTGSPSNAVTVTSLSAPTTPSASASGDTELCPGESVTLNATNVCAGCTVMWSNNQTGTSIVVNTPGVYTATASNACGTGSPSNAVTVTGLSAPTTPSASASGDTELCPGESVTLSATNICAGCTVKWSNNQTGTSIVVNTPGVYTATASNTCGTGSPSNAVTVTGLSAPTTPSASASGDTELCPGESVTLSATNVCAGCTVKWSNNQTGTSIVVNTPGVYTATTSNACGTGSPSNGITVTFAAPPPAPVLSALGVPELCQGQTVTLVATGVCANCILTWSGGQTGLNITVASPGVYGATVTDACGLTAVAVPFEVKQAPPYVPVVQVNNTCYLAAPQGSEYQWGLNGLDIPGATTQFLTAQTTGYYTVQMKNLSGCSGKSDPLFAQACSSSAGEQEKSIGLQLFPNPTTGRLALLVKTERPIDGSFDVFRSDGRFAGNFFRDRLASGEHALHMELSGFSPGVYYYVFKTETEIFRGAFVVVE
jgi:hypothetical protein